MGCPADLVVSLRRGEGAVAIGVNVSADAVTAVIADGRGNVISPVERPVPRQCRADVNWPAQGIGGAVQSLCADFADDLSTEVSETAALVIGVSVPGVVDKDGRSVYRSEILGLQDVPPMDPMRRSLSFQVSGSSGLSGSLEVRLYQNAGCGAQAESQWGAAGRSCLYLAVGERISPAVLPGGASVSGEGWAGQVSRILVPGPDWSGKRACLEDVAPVCVAVRRHTAGMFDDSVASEPGDREDASDGSFAQRAMRSESLLDTIISGDREARRARNIGLDCLAKLIVQGAGLFDPLNVVVNSELIRAGEATFLEPLRGRVADLVGDLLAPRLVAARLEAAAPALGVAGCALAD